MESEHDEDGNKQVSGDDEHKMINSEETESVIIHLETNSTSSSSSSPSSSSSSSSSSSNSSPPKHLPMDGKESSSNEPEVSPTDSPHVQVMDRGNNNGDQVINYDPNRIPSSVFERSKSNIPAEWSCNSNESLFSIHLGRNSFTVDYMKSGELYKSGELLAYSPELPMPPPPGGEESKLVLDSDIVLDEKKETHKTSNEEDEDEEKRESHDKEQQPAVSWKTPTTSYRSNRSSNSTHSFSFPILAGAASDSGKKETEEQKKKQAKQSQDSQQQQADEANQKQSMCRCFSCFPPCPWCCSSCSCS